MSPQLRIDLTSGTPADQQIRDQVAGHVLDGSLPSGDRVPTVRRLARDLRLNTGTVARAYRDLESDLVLVRRRRIWSVKRISPLDRSPTATVIGPEPARVLAVRPSTEAPTGMASSRTPSAPEPVGPAPLDPDGPAELSTSPVSSPGAVSSGAAVSFTSPVGSTGAVSSAGELGRLLPVPLDLASLVAEITAAHSDSATTPDREARR